MRKSVRYVLIAVCCISTAIVLLVALNPANHALPTEAEPSGNPIAQAPPAQTPLPSPEPSPEPTPVPEPEPKTGAHIRHARTHHHDDI